MQRLQGEVWVIQLQTVCPAEKPNEQLKEGCVWVHGLTTQAATARKAVLEGPLSCGSKEIRPLAQPRDPLHSTWPWLQKDPEPRKIYHPMEMMDRTWVDALTLSHITRYEMSTSCCTKIQAWWCLPVILILQRWRQGNYQDRKFRASLPLRRISNKTKWFLCYSYHPWHPR